MLIDTRPFFYLLLALLHIASFAMSVAIPHVRSPVLSTTSREARPSANCSTKPKLASKKLRHALFLMPGRWTDELSATTSSPTVNCSDSVMITRISTNGDDWKSHVIIACTVIAAIETVIVILTIIYWKQLRWLLRKLSCPCDGHYRPSEQNEPLNSQGSSPVQTTTSVPDDPATPSTVEVSLIEHFADYRGGTPATTDHRSTEMDDTDSHL